METGFRGSHPAAAFGFFTVAFAIGMSATHPLLLCVSLAAALIYDLTLRRGGALRFLCRVILPGMALITVCNGLFSHYGVTPLLTLPSGNRLTLEALAFGGVFALRAACALLWLDCFNVVITNEKMIYLFGRFSPKTALVISMALRFLPLIASQKQQIAAAARAAGDLPGRGPARRLRSGARRASVLASWVLEKGVDTADAMRARGYGLPGRRSRGEYTFRGTDAALLFAAAAVGAGYLCVFRALTASYNPIVEVPSPGLCGYAAVAAAALLFLLPPVWDRLDRLRYRRAMRRMRGALCGKETA